MVTTATTTAGPSEPPDDCGDGVIDEGEECDDGNNENGDGCDENCMIERHTVDFPCGDDCLDGTIITVTVPVVHPDRITYSFNKTAQSQGRCEVNHFILFDIPNCTTVVNVTSYPPNCVEEISFPCGGGDGDDDDDDDNDCREKVGSCRDDFAALIGRPVKVDITGNECSVTLWFDDNMTFVEAPFGIKGGLDCSNCTALVPHNCYEPPEVLPEFVCSWNFTNGTCLAAYNYTVVDGIGVVIIPKGPTNRLVPGALPGTDNTPHIFTVPGQTMGRTARWDCTEVNGTGWLLWYLDGETANATLGAPVKCEDCNENSLPDPWDIETGVSADCNGNCIPDECDIESGHSEDNNTNNIPDECEVLATTTPPTASEALHSGLPGYIISGTMLTICVIASMVALYRDWGSKTGTAPIWASSRRARSSAKSSDRPRAGADASSRLMKPRTRGGPLSFSHARSGNETDQSVGGHRKPS